MSGSYTWPMVTPSPRLPGLKGLKLQFHCVPCSLEITRVPDGPPAVDPDEPDPELEPLHAASAVASAVASSAAPPTWKKRLMGGPSRRSLVSEGVTLPSTVAI